MKKIIVKQEQVPTEIMSTMGCRTQNSADINASDSYKKNIKSLIENGTFYDDVFSASQKDSRGNICPTTIILPTLAMQAKRAIYRDLKIELTKAILNGETLNKNPDKQIDVSDEDIDKAVCDAFMKLLDKKIHEAKDSLLERFDWITSQPAASAKFMYENGTMGGYVKEEGIKSALRHGTLAIGQLGLAEALHILIGCNHTSEKGMTLAKRIEQLFKDKCAQFKQEYKLNFGVYYTPSENLCYTAMKKFKAKYGVIEHVSDHDYFTNSIHVPVWEKMTPFEKIDIESQLTGYSSAGCITYVELDGSAKNNNQAVEELVNYAMDKDIPYLGINLKLDSCEDCGYSDEIGEKCPQCGSSNITRLRRVTGYLTGDYKTAFNYGKQKETEDRVEHTAIEI